MLFQHKNTFSVAYWDDTCVGDSSESSRPSYFLSFYSFTRQIFKGNLLHPTFATSIELSHLVRIAKPKQI